MAGRQRTCVKAAASKKMTKNESEKRRQSEIGVKTKRENRISVAAMAASAKNQNMKDMKTAAALTCALRRKQRASKWRHKRNGSALRAASLAPRSAAGHQ
jgi:hypothetical protein